MRGQWIHTKKHLLYSGKKRKEKKEPFGSNCNSLYLSFFSKFTSQQYMLVSITKSVHFFIIYSIQKKEKKKKKKKSVHFFSICIISNSFPTRQQNKDPSLSLSLSLSQLKSYSFLKQKNKGKLILTLGDKRREGKKIRSSTMIGPHFLLNI